MLHVTNPEAPAWANRRYAGHGTEERTGTPAIELGDGARIWIRPAPFRADMPHAYYDRLQARLRTEQRGARRLIERRIGYLGAAQPVRYALIVHTVPAVDGLALAAGAALDRREAWIFDAELRTGDFGLGVARLLEQIAALPVYAAPHREISPTGILSAPPSG